MTTATQYVIKPSDEEKTDTVTPAPDSDLILPLDVGAYWIEMCILFGSTGSHRGSVRFDGTLYDPGVHVTYRSMYGYYTGSFYDGTIANNWHTSQDSLATEYAHSNLVGSPSPVIIGHVWYSGRITCSTAGDFGYWWRKLSGSASKVLAGSWIYATPLDICPI